MVVRRRSKAPGGKLTSCGKVKKWFRMVILLTFKKYGARILWQLFFAYLLTDAVKAMHSIWTDFADFKNCQDQYIKTISTNVSADYDAVIISGLTGLRCFIHCVVLCLLCSILFTKTGVT